MSNPLHLADDSFDSAVAESKLPVIVDFWATWCGPCRALAHTIEKIAADYDGKITVAKVDVDQAPATSAKFGIRSIPTIVALRNGVEVARTIGNNPKAVTDMAEGLL